MLAQTQGKAGRQRSGRTLACCNRDCEPGRHMVMAWSIDMLVAVRPKIRKGRRRLDWRQSRWRGDIVGRRARDRPAQHRGEVGRA
jgi:hypothetical protein